MTREEALNNLDDLLQYGGLMMSEKYIESIRIAANELEKTSKQEPCEEVLKIYNDLIETRNMLLNHVITLDQKIKELSNEDKCEGGLDNQLLIKALKDIQKLCKSTPICKESCPFFTNKSQSYVGCWFTQMADLPAFPMSWDFNQLEEKEKK